MCETEKTKEAGGEREEEDRAPESLGGIWAEAFFFAQTTWISLGGPFTETSYSPRPHSSNVLSAPNFIYTAENISGMPLSSQN